MNLAYTSIVLFCLSMHVKFCELVFSQRIRAEFPHSLQWLQIYLIVKLYRRVLGYTIWNTSETTNDGLTQTLFVYSFKRGHTLRPARCLGFWCWEEGGGFISGYSKCLLRKQLYVQHATKGLLSYLNFLKPHCFKITSWRRFLIKVHIYEKLFKNTQDISVQSPKY